MGVAISPVESPSDLTRFIELPWKVYRDYHHWVPPLISEQRALLEKSHPFHRHADVQLFLARDNGEVVGRIAAIVNHQHVSFHEEPCGFFGFFESIDATEVAQALISTAAEWLRARDMKIIRGPTNPSTNEECGLLVDAFDKPPCFMMPYNPPYYHDLMDACGLAKAMDLHAYYQDTTISMSRAERVLDRIKRRANVRVRYMDLNKVDEEVARLKVIYHGSWARNWGFVPLTDEEFDLQAKDFAKVVVPDLALMIEIDDKPVAFSLTLPDYNEVLAHLNGRLGLVGLLKWLWYRRKIKGTRMLLMGVLPEYQRRGLDAVLIAETVRSVIRLGYRYAELSWVLETNSALRNLADRWGLQHYKTYRIYERTLHGS